MDVSDFHSEDYDGDGFSELVVVDPVLSSPGAENDLYAQFGAGLLTDGLYSDEKVDPVELDGGPRDWIILEDCKARLEATGAFDGVYLCDPSPSDDPGIGSSQTAIAIPTLQEFDEEGYLDRDQARLTKWTLTIASRSREPAVRDQMAARLFSVAKRALDHKCLAGYTFKDWTILRRARWEKPKDAERRLTIAGEWGYFLGDSEDDP